MGSLGRAVQRSSPWPLDWGRQREMKPTFPRWRKLRPEGQRGRVSDLAHPNLCSCHVVRRLLSGAPLWGPSLGLPPSPGRLPLQEPLWELASPPLFCQTRLHAPHCSPWSPWGSPLVGTPGLGSSHFHTELWPAYQEPHAGVSRAGQRGGQGGNEGESKETKGDLTRKSLFLIVF